MSQDIYINTMKDQINSGMYDHLFMGRKDLVFLDIGANIGLVSIYAVPYCKRIVAVEPSPYTFEKLRDNTKHYQVIECYCAALAPVNEMVDFYENDINFTASSTVNTYGTKTRVSGLTLESILRENKLTHVDVCKCDAEGAEGESLSLEQLDAARGIIDAYFIEFHNCPKTSWEHKLGTTVGNLSRCGYRNISTSPYERMAITASK